MAQLSQPIEPFGEVNVHLKKDGSIDIVATILMVPDIEGARTGLALDASASMKRMYGISGIVGGPFAKASGIPNVVEPVAQTMASFLANFSANGKCSVIYWACAADGSQVEPIGEFDGAAAEILKVSGPKKQPWGRGTKLLPPVKHFIETAFPDAPWAICVFVTDGVIEDLEDVKKYCLNFARQISAGKRAFVKLVLIGVGEEVNEAQMEELDDMFEGSGIKDPKGNDIDLWDHKMAKDMTKLEEIFAEVVDEGTIVAGPGQITNQAGTLCKDYSDGVPAMLRFSLPAGSTLFKLAFPGGEIVQDISEGLTRK